MLLRVDRRNPMTAAASCTRGARRRLPFGNPVTVDSSTGERDGFSPPVILSAPAGGCFYGFECLWLAVPPSSTSCGRPPPSSSTARRLGPTASGLIAFFSMVKCAGISAVERRCRSRFTRAGIGPKPVSTGPVAPGWSLTQLLGKPCIWRSGHDQTRLPCCGTCRARPDGCAYRGPDRASWWFACRPSAKGHGAPRLCGALIQKKPIRQYVRSAHVLRRVMCDSRPPDDLRQASASRGMSGRPGAAIDSSCRSAIMNLMEDQQAPQSGEGEAKVITLCGSTRFEAEFAEVNQRLTMEGCIVISLGMFSLPDLPDYDWTADSSDLKGRLGGVHLQKIRMADEVYIVDPGGYVGESTRREIAYAESLGKPVRYLSRERSARTADGPQE